MDLKKEMLCYTEQIGRGKAKTVAETDVIVPDTKPDAEKILNTDSVFKISGYEVQSGRVLVYGAVKFAVLYASKEGEVKCVEANTSFTDVLEVKGAEPEMEAEITCTEGYTECKILNGRKLYLKSVLNISAEVFKTCETEAVSEINEALVEEKKRKISYIKKNGATEKEFNIKEIIEIAKDLPSVAEILKADGKISNMSTKIINNKVIVKADLDTVILYNDDTEHKPCVVSVSVPFTEIFDIEGINDKWFFMQDMYVTDVICKKQDDADERALEIEANVKSNIITATFCEKNMLCDCYAIEKNAEMVKENFCLLAETGRVDLQSGIKTTVDLKQLPKFVKMYNVTAKAYVSGLEKTENEIFVKGKAVLDMTYLSDDAKIAVCSVKQEIPFREAVKNASSDSEEGTVFSSVSGISYTLSGNDFVEIRGNLFLSGILTKSLNEELVTAVALTECEKDKKMASVTVCFADESDSLWDIAKKYRTSKKIIMEANGIKETDSINGKQLIIPKYKAI